MSFTWNEFFKELFLKVVNDFDSKSLAKVAAQIFPDNSLLDYDQLKNKMPLNELEPCTFLAIFNRGISDHSRIELCKKAKAILNLKSIVPGDFDGIPVIPPMAYWYYPWSTNRDGFEIPALWKFAKELANFQIHDETFNNALKSRGTGLPKLTITCFIVWPDKFLPLDKHTISFLAKRNKEYINLIKSLKNSDEPFSPYLHLLEMIKKAFPEKSFQEISREAYLESVSDAKNGKRNLEHDTVSYWVAGATRMKATEDLSQEFIQHGIWRNGYLENSGDSSVSKVKQANPGDYIAIKSSSIKGKGRKITFTRIKAIGKITENPRDGVNLKVDWIYKGPAFDIDRISYRKTFQRIIDEEVIQKIFGQILGTNQSINKSLIPDTPIKATNSNNPRNQIYWGPPGTGKTYQLLQLQKEFEDRLGKNTLDYITEWVQDHTWWDVITASLIEFDRPVTVPELFKHDLIQIKSRQSSTKTPKNTLWSLLQAHTIKESTTVNFERRQEPLIVDKDNQSRWFLTNGGKEQLPDLKTELKEIRSGDKTEIIKRYKMVTFHQSYSYEEFVEGIRPIIGADGSSISYGIISGIFKKLCELATSNPSQEYAIFIDEINRGNISKIFGELITLIEIDKRLGKDHATTVTLPYSGETFGVPSNLHIFGTMNSVDRSIALVDMALRRRFEFITMRPDSKHIKNQINGINLISIFEKLNQKISVILGSEYQLGHSYFMNEKASNLQTLRETWFGNVLPLLQEYLFDDWEKLRALVGDFVIETKVPSLEELAIPRTTYGSFVTPDISDLKFTQLLKALE